MPFDDAHFTGRSALNVVELGGGRGGGGGWKALAPIFFFLKEVGLGVAPLILPHDISSEWGGEGGGEGGGERGGGKEKFR